MYAVAFNPLEVVKMRQQVVSVSSSSPIMASASSSSSSNVKTSNTAASSSSRVSNAVKSFHRGRGAALFLRNSNNGGGLMIPNVAFPCLVAPQYRVSATMATTTTSSAAACPSGSKRLFESMTLAASRLLRSPPSTRKDGGCGGGGIFRTLLSIARSEGRSGLYAGLRPSLLVVVPNTAIYFTAYDEITMRWLRRHGSSSLVDRDNTSATAGQQQQQPFWLPLFAGATARFISCVATAPLELVRTRQVTAIGGGGANNTHNNGIVDELRLLLRSNDGGGIRSLYRGLGPTILRDVPFSALYFLLLERCKSSLSNSTLLGSWGVRSYIERENIVPVRVEILQSFIGGMTAGAIATILTTPFDVVKTRRQAASTSETVATRTTATSTLGCMRQIVKDEGFFTGLWKGNRTRMMKVAPGCAIMISCYEFGKITFEDIL